MKRLLLVAFLTLAVATFAVAQGDFTLPTQERTDASKIVQIYPNPAVEYIHVKIETVKINKMKLSVHNIIGNEMPVDIEYVDEHEARLRIKDLSSGYYLLSIKEKDSGINMVHKILKK